MIRLGGPDSGSLGRLQSTRWWGAASSEGTTRAEDPLPRWCPGLAAGRRPQLLHAPHPLLTPHPSPAVSSQWHGWLPQSKCFQREWGWEPRLLYDLGAEDTGCRCRYPVGPTGQPCPAWRGYTQESRPGDLALMEVADHSDLHDEVKKRPSVVQRHTLAKRDDGGM